jgi:hypothetical protein
MKGLDVTFIKTFTNKSLSMFAEEQGVNIRIRAAGYDTIFNWTAVNEPRQRSNYIEDLIGHTTNISEATEKTKEGDFLLLKDSFRYLPRMRGGTNGITIKTLKGNSISGALSVLCSPLYRFQVRHPPCVQ